MRQPVEQLFRQMDELRQTAHVLGKHVPVADAEQHAQRVGNAAGGGPAGIQAAGGILKHHLNLRAQGMMRKEARRQQTDVVTEQADGAFVAAARAGTDVDEARQHADERGLAGTRFPGNAEAGAAFSSKDTSCTAYTPGVKDL